MIIDAIFNVMTLLRKELLMILKDKRGRIILVAPVIVQTIVFGFVATFDLNRADFALLDEDHSASSRELVRNFEASPIFTRAMTLQNADQIADVLDNKKALFVLHIGSDFERELNLGRNAPVQVLVDGRNSNTAGTAAGYVQTIIELFNAGRAQAAGQHASRLTISTRSWFNPNLETRWGILTSLLATLSVIQVMVLAGQSAAREKEQGTFDQLLVTPFSSMTIMLGKAVPPVLVGLVQSGIVFAVTLLFFSIPFAGSLLLLLTALIIANFAVVGIGLCISAISSTMQQAMLYSFTLLMPMILLSGFVTPISAMPEIFQWATLINPVRYGVDFAQRIYLEGAGLQDILYRDLLPLAVIAFITLGMASRLFRSKL